ncbi:GNAT family N-acetyltransferase [Guptibacillus algicola]|uniref:GNAT family N-acetyltransferase n=1 Tax=Guptibacillus algicola TaxID=225844 RepID=UPI001CD542B1|nr:GNAT family N-acetyltransferase [Alkalihalobacillus algicola]MCA0988416.1 GNAT family N-acetyltransferase [Alkalihalobacillus algicola]
MDSIAIRMVEEKDIPLVQRYVSQKEVARTTNVPEPYPEGGAKEWYKIVMEEKERGKHFPFAILFDGEFAGSISLRVEKDGQGAIDYWVAPPFWNKGIGTEAVKRVIAFGENQVGLEAIETCCLKENPGSSMVLEKNGFRYIRDFEIDPEEKHGGKIAQVYRLEF